MRMSVILAWLWGCHECGEGLTQESLHRADAKFTCDWSEACDYEPFGPGVSYEECLDKAYESAEIAIEWDSDRCTGFDACEAERCLDEMKKALEDCSYQRDPDCLGGRAWAECNDTTE
jgi:hypothetical protein